MAVSCLFPGQGGTQGGLGLPPPSPYPPTQTLGKQIEIVDNHPQRPPGHKSFLTPHFVKLNKTEIAS